MSVQQMRAAIYDVYPGRKWKIKVQNMPDDQVIAVYYSFLAKGKFDKPAEPPKLVWHHDPNAKPLTYEEAVEAITKLTGEPPYVGEQLKLDI